MDILQFPCGLFLGEFGPFCSTHVGFIYYSISELVFFVSCQNRSIPQCNADAVLQRLLLAMLTYVNVVSCACYCL